MVYAKINQSVITLTFDALFKILHVFFSNFDDENQDHTTVQRNVKVRLARLDSKPFSDDVRVVKRVPHSHTISKRVFKVRVAL